MNDTHVQEENIAQAGQTLDNVEAYGTTASLQTGNVAETQGGAKWSDVRGASGSSDAMRKISTELSKGMQSAAKTTKSFCELIHATHREFRTQDEQGQQLMAGKLQELCDVFQGYNQGTRSARELGQAMSAMAATVAMASAGLLSSAGSGDTEEGQG
ncbi:MAG: hypothetical protein Q4E05_10700 [Pseudoclavibacter sp.]|nr:hypothetical protein [Pseudoclavibacter sp.]